VSEINRTRDVSQWKLIRDRAQVSQENLYYIQYYKGVYMSNDKKLNIPNGYMPHCGINCWDESMERRDVVDNRYLASISALCQVVVY